MVSSPWPKSERTGVYEGNPSTNAAKYPQIRKECTIIIYGSVYVSVSTRARSKGAYMHLVLYRAYAFCTAYILIRSLTQGVHTACRLHYVYVYGLYGPVTACWYCAVYPNWSTPPVTCHRTFDLRKAGLDAYHVVCTKKIMNGRVQSYIAIQ